MPDKIKTWVQVRFKNKQKRHLIGVFENGVGDGTFHSRRREYEIRAVRMMMQS